MRIRDASADDRARRAGMHVVVAAVDGENSGLCHGGAARQTRFKFGRWLDLVFMQVVLDEQGR